jgi:hypothetical protein
MRPNDIHEGDGILVTIKDEPQDKGTRFPKPGELKVHTAHILTVTKATPSTLEASTETNHEIITLTAALNETTGEYDTPQVSITPTGYGDTETPTYGGEAVVVYPLGAPIKPGDPTPIHGCVPGAYGHFNSDTDNSIVKGVFTAVYKEAAVLNVGYADYVVALNDAYDSITDPADIVKNVEHFCDVLPLDVTAHAALEHAQQGSLNSSSFNGLAIQLTSTIGKTHVVEIMDKYVLDAIDVARLNGDTSNIGETIIKRTHNGVNAELSHLLDMLEATERHLKSFQERIKESISALEESPLHDSNLVAEYKENI